MTKPELAKRLARQAGLSTAEAADRLDHVVSRIIASLKKGESAPLPGLGKFTPGPRWNFRFDQRSGTKAGRRGQR